MQKKSPLRGGKGGKREKKFKDQKETSMPFLWYYTQRREVLFRKKYKKTIKNKIMQKTLGGDRLGAGKKQQVDLHGYGRSTHDMGYLWRSTMSSGTLVPFLCEIALPGDTFNIDLNAVVMTHPTIGPLFGSYKVQLDVFETPIRLYNSLLHNNMLGIGLDIKSVLFPVITLTAPNTADNYKDLDNSQINPSCILSYLGLRGIGYNEDTEESATRQFNGIPFLAYWDIYKNYYANKQENIGAVIHSSFVAVEENVVSITGDSVTIEEQPLTSNVVMSSASDFFIINKTGVLAQPIGDIFMNTLEYGWQSLLNLSNNDFTDAGAVETGTYNAARWGTITITQWRYRTAYDGYTGNPQITQFPLTMIDDMRTNILAYSSKLAPFEILDQGLSPYNLINDTVNSLVSTQEGLGLKTYQSDLFNNWLNTESFDGPGGINELSAVDVSGGTLQMDALNLAKKVYDMLNRIAVSGGTFDDWLDVQYDHQRYTRCESPMYMGGLSKELIFQEVISNSQSAEQPLGTLAGRGTMAKKHKGGRVTIKVTEPSYIIGIVSLTPRIDYSQGNKWDVHLKNMSEIHVPALDEIGFQELITEQMAWWSTNWNSTGNVWETKSAGKQPAWTNYTTNVNVVRGNFAIATNEMFMTLNRRYEPEVITGGLQIADLTTYIDPSKYNNIFAETATDAQNFWVQISVDMVVRRKMSARVMPNV